MENLHVTGQTKTYEGWNAQLEEYLQPGDCVDEEFFWYLLEVVPPRTQSGTMIQVGEASDHNGPEGSARFTTLQKYGSYWYYTGRRVAGESVALLQAVAS